VLRSEAKILDGRGFKWLREGLTKLVGKYESGRSALALFLCYCKRDRVHQLRKQFADEVATLKTAGYHGDVPLAEHDFSDLLGVFVTAHDCKGRTIHVAHVWVDLFAPLDKEIKRRAADDAKKNAQAVPPPPEKPVES
jgi:hypothetical protein